MAIPTEIDQNGKEGTDRPTESNNNDTKKTNDENTLSEICKTDETCISDGNEDESILYFPSLGMDIAKERTFACCPIRDIKEFYRMFHYFARQIVSFLTCSVLLLCRSTTKYLVCLRSLVILLSLVPVSKVKLKFEASTSAFSENIRLSVFSFFSEKCNIRKPVKGLFRHFVDIIRHSPTYTCISVFPAYTLSDYHRELESNPELPEADRMKYDLLRTSSFSNFPLDCPVSTLRLAKAGFYYQGNADEVICFKCDIKHRNWQFRDDPVFVHKRISPNCSFIQGLEEPLQNEGADRNQGTCLYSEHANVDQNTQAGTDVHLNESHERTVAQQAADLGNNTESAITNQDANAESNSNNVRESHYASNIDVSTSSRMENDINNFSSQPEHAPSGSGMSSRSDTNIAGSSRANNSLTENITDQSHTVDSNVSTPSTNVPQATGSSATSTLEPLGISIAKPKYPQYAVLATRMSSFNSWPTDIGQRPEELAKAGFVYEGVNDFTRCFFCAGGLRDWEPNDIPWIEHARWYENCVFVRQCKGEEFVNLVKQGRIEEATQILNGRKTINREDGRADFMQSAAAISVLEMGYSRDIVEKAVHVFCRSKDINDLSAELLLQAVWDLESETNAANKNVSATDAKSDDDIRDTNASANSSQRNDDEDADEASRSALLAENRQLKEQQICKICMDEEISIVFLPCGHMVTCVNCAPAIRKCPLCRRFIKGTIKAILS